MRADHRDGDLRALAHVRSAADDLQYFFAGVYFADRQAIRVRVPIAAFDMPDDDLIKALRQILNAFDFKSTHREFTEHAFEISTDRSDIEIFGEPIETNLHPRLSCLGLARVEGSHPGRDIITAPQTLRS